MLLKGTTFAIFRTNTPALILFFLIAQLLSAQVPNENKIQEILQDIYEQTGTHIKYEEIEFYLENPKPLEKYNSDELSSIIGIPLSLAKKIKKIYYNNMVIESICDSLNLSPSQCTLLKLITFQEKTVPSKMQDSNFLINIRSRFYYSSTNIDKNQIGDPIDSYQRISLTSKLFDFGISTSKDPGEKSYFDSYKFFFHKELGTAKLILGNFIVKNSNGLILWTPYSISKTPSSIFSVLTNKFHIQPTLTTSNFGTFRGLAGKATIPITEISYFTLSSFISKIPRSGNIDTTGNIVTSFYISDLFAEPNEIFKKNNIDEKAFFLLFQFNSEKFSFSYSRFFLLYDKFINTSSRKFITGSSAVLHSFSSRVSLSKNIILTNEFAFNKFYNKSLINSIIFQKNTISSLLSCRYISPNFRSPFGVNIGENSYPNNEQGILFAAQFKAKPLGFEVLLDNFKTLQPISNIEFPIFGNDFYFQAQLPIYLASFKVRFQRKEKTNYIKSINNSKQIPYQKVQYRFMGEMRLSFYKKINVLSRFDYTKINNQGYKNNESGLNFLIQCNYEILKEWEFGACLNLFSTTSFESAVYVFEYIAPGLMQSAAFYNKGLKIILSSSLKLIENRVRMYIRYHYESKNPTKHFILAQGEITLGL